MRNLSIFKPTSKAWVKMGEMVKIRKTISIFGVLIVFIVLLNSAHSFSKSRAIRVVKIRNYSGQEVGLYEESYALIIGVSNYTGGWPKLPGVKKDIAAVRAILERHGFHVVTVLDPSKNDLEDAFEDFISNYGRKENNRLLFYFAGHGHTIKPKYGGEPLGYIVPKEAPNPYRELADFRRIALSMQRVEEYALQIDSKHALFLFDSCFSGSLFALSRAVPENISYKTARPVRQFITSGSADEQVQDTSIFASQFVDALSGEGDLDKDGYVTGTELGEFLQGRVVNYSKGAQHPQYGKIRHPNLDKGDYVFKLTKSEYEPELPSYDFKAEQERLAQERKKLRKEKEVLEQMNILEKEREKLEAERRWIEEEKKRQLTAIPKVESRIATKDQTKIYQPGEYTFSLTAGEMTAHWIKLPRGVLYSVKSKDNQFKLLYDGEAVPSWQPGTWYSSNGKFKIVAVADQPRITMVIKKQTRKKKLKVIGEF